MTKPRKWPHNMKHHRDQASDANVAAKNRTKRLIKRVEQGKFTKLGLENDLRKILALQEHALKHLRATGAEIPLDDLDDPFAPFIDDMDMD